MKASVIRRGAYIQIFRNQTDHRPWAKPERQERKGARVSRI